MVWNSFATPICYFAPSLVKALQQTLSQSSSSYCCSFASHLDPWTASHLAAARKHSVVQACCRRDKHNISERYVYSSARAESKIFFMCTIFKRNTELSAMLFRCLLSKGSRYPFVQERRWPTRASDKAWSAVRSSQESWVPDSLDSGYWAARAHHALSGHGEALRLQSTVLLQMKTPAWQNTVLSFVTEQDNLLS